MRTLKVKSPEGEKGTGWKLRASQKKKSRCDALKINDAILQTTD